MYTRTKDQIIEIIKENGQIQVRDLVQSLEITQAAVHRALNKLLAQNKIVRKGTPPKVFYSLANKSPTLPLVDLKVDEIDLVQKNYLYIDPKAKLKKVLKDFSPG